MDKRLRDQIRAIEREGFTVLRVAPQGNQHVRAYVSTAAGERFLTLPMSPSGGAGSAAKIAGGKARSMKRRGEGQAERGQ